jgi:hypothetical protein
VNEHTLAATASLAHLNAVVTALVTAHPDAAIRIARGADLVEAGAVEPTYGGVYLVYSQSEPNRAYALVQDRGRWLCDCADAQQRGQGCKHHWSAVIYHACERLDAEQGDPTPEPCCYPCDGRKAVDAPDLPPGWRTCDCPCDCHELPVAAPDLDVDGPVNYELTEQAIRYLDALPLPA